MKDRLLFLDFDGVICDSLPETLMSSWLAYYKYIRHEIPDSMPIDLKTRFQVIRPLIRSGEDYCVIQDLLFHAQTVSSQADFDALVKEAGEATMKEYKQVFYAARSELLEWDRQAWLSLNPLFAPIKSALAKKSGDRRIFVLSTKKKEFIEEIFSGNNLSFPGDNIIYSGNENKISIIAECLVKRRATNAVFIDDQISHLVDVQDERIRVYLAAWGYVKKEWLAETHQVPVVSLSEAVRLIERF